MLRLHSDNPEPLVAPGLAPDRPAVRAREEVPDSLGEVSQRLRLSHLAARAQPFNLGPGLSELTRLLQVTGRAAAPGPPPGLLFDRRFSRVPGMGAMVPQDGFLDGRRHQAVTGHSNTISGTSDISEEVKRRFLPSLEAGVFTPRI